MNSNLRRFTVPEMVERGPKRIDQIVRNISQRTRHNLRAFNLLSAVQMTSEAGQKLHLCIVWFEKILYEFTKCSGVFSVIL